MLVCLVAKLRTVAVDIELWAVVGCITPWTPFNYGYKLCHSKELLTYFDAIIQAWSQATKEGKDAITKIGQALDSIDYQQLSSKYRSPVIRSQDQVNGSFYHHNQSTCRASEPLLNDASGPKLHKESDEVEIEIPFELITSCVATLTMIQVIKTSNVAYFTTSHPIVKLMFSLAYSSKEFWTAHLWGRKPIFEWWTGASWY